MNMEAEIDIVEIVRSNPAAVFTDDAITITDLVERLERDLSSGVADLGTQKGRNEIKSRAHSVTKFKTSIDSAGKDMNAGLREKINVVDAVRREARDELEALKGRIRKPLDDWEEQEQARIDSHRAVIERLTALGAVSLNDTRDTLRARLYDAAQIDVSSAAMQEFADLAAGKKESSIGYLRAALERAEREEVERAELERLRKESAERDAREAAEREERERVERAAEAERQRVADEERRKREIAEAEARAAEQAMRDAETRAESERAELIRKQEQAEAERRAEEQRKADEEAARAANREHRSKIMTSAKEAIMEAGQIGEDRAKKIITAICSGSIPHVSIKF